MGLDVYAGPVSRYVSGGWHTIVQQAGEAIGMPVITIRPGESVDQLLSRALAEGAAGGGVTEVRLSDLQPVAQPIAKWKAGLLASLRLNENWTDAPDGPYYTDKPGWEGYGAAVLLAAYDEQPSLAPGAKVKRLFGTSTMPAVPPDRFGDAEAYRVAAASPSRYPTLLSAEWCLPIEGGPVVFNASTPTGREVRMGHVSLLYGELELLNQRTLRLSPADMEAARQAGPPPSGPTVKNTAPFGVSVLMAAAEFAVKNRTAWILDY